MLKQQGKGGVFEHIGEITGVIGVAVVHLGLCRLRRVERFHGF
jgi:hypothetical protein